MNETFRQQVKDIIINKIEDPNITNEQLVKIRRYIEDRLPKKALEKLNYECQTKIDDLTGFISRVSNRDTIITTLSYINSWRILRGIHSYIINEKYI